MMDKKYLAWLSTDGNGQSLPRLSSTNKPKVKDLPKVTHTTTGKSPEKVTNIQTETKADKTVTLRIPSLADVKKYPIWIIMAVIVVGGSMTVAIPTLATLDLTSLSSSSAPPVSLDSQTFVVSRVRFDPTSTITMNGVTAAGATAVFTQVVKANFLAEMGDIITIDGIKVQNLGATNAIAAVEVIAPQGISVDVRSPAGAGNELRLLGTNTFALPIDAGTSTTPGSATIQIRLVILTGPLDPSTSQQFSIEVGISGLD